jgi:hypothetical protein
VCADCHLSLFVCAAPCAERHQSTLPTRPTSTRCTASRRPRYTDSPPLTRQASHSRALAVFVLRTWHTPLSVCDISGRDRVRPFCSYRRHHRDRVGVCAQGKRFILVTDPSVGDLKEELRKIYSSIFVEYVIKNPLFKIRYTCTTHHYQDGTDQCHDSSSSSCLALSRSLLLTHRWPIGPAGTRKRQPLKSRSRSASCSRPNCTSTCRACPAGAPLPSHASCLCSSEQRNRACWFAPVVCVTTPQSSRNRVRASSDRPWPGAPRCRRHIMPRKVKKRREMGRGCAATPQTRSGIG